MFTDVPDHRLMGARMQQVRVTGEFGVDLEQCLRHMATPDLYEYVARHQGVLDRRFSGVREEGDVRTWEVELTLLEQIPALARPFVPSDRVRWRQRFTLDMATLEFRFDIDHPLPARLMAAGGRGRLSAEGPGRSRIEIEVQLESHLPVIGRQLEAYVAQRTKHMLERDVQLRREYMEGHTPIG
jgi:hypothetical protein